MAPRNLSHEDPLRRIRAITAYKKKLDIELLEAMTEAREAGASWGQIGNAMDYTRHGAYTWYTRHRSQL